MMNFQDLRHIDAAEKISITDEVLAPDNQQGRVHEFGTDGDGESIAKIWITSLYDGAPIAAWYKTKTLKKV